MKNYTIDDILTNTDNTVLFNLFAEFLERIVDKTESVGVFSVDDEYKPNESLVWRVFTKPDIRSVIDVIRSEL